MFRSWDNMASHKKIKNNLFLFYLQGLPRLVILHVKDLVIKHTWTANVRNLSKRACTTPFHKGVFLVKDDCTKSWSSSSVILQFFLYGHQLSTKMKTCKESLVVSSYPRQTNGMLLNSMLLLLRHYFQILIFGFSLKSRFDTVVFIVIDDNIDILWQRLRFNHRYCRMVHPLLIGCWMHGNARITFRLHVCKNRCLWCVSLSNLGNWIYAFFVSFYIYFVIPKLRQCELCKA